MGLWCKAAIFLGILLLRTCSGLISGTGKGGESLSLPSNTWSKFVRMACVGICHSDLHTAKGEWGDAIFPMVPGHEIIGVVTEVGKDVKSFKVGERAGVGCFVDSCRQCNQCHGHEEQFCQEGMVSSNGFYVVRLSFQKSVIMCRISDPIVHIALQKWPRSIMSTANFTNPSWHQEILSM